MRRTGWLIAAGLLALAIPATSAHAWVITQVDPDPSAGYSGAVVVPYADEPTADVYEIHKFFVKDPNDAPIPLPLILSFTRQEGDKDVIQIVDEIILNLQVSQQRIWDDFHVAVIGGEHPVSFIDPGAATAWQQTGGASRLGGVPISFTGTQIDWLDANERVPYGTFASAPTNQLVLRGLTIDVSQLAVGETFFLKEWPTIPEPCTVTLLALGAGAAVLRRRRR